MSTVALDPPRLARYLQTAERLDIEMGAIASSLQQAADDASVADSASDPRRAMQVAAARDLAAQIDGLARSERCTGTRFWIAKQLMEPDPLGSAELEASKR